jgi:hypothetical protein
MATAKRNFFINQLYEIDGSYPSTESFLIWVS